MSNLPDDVTHSQFDAALEVPAYDTDPEYADWLDWVLKLLGDDDMDRVALHTKGAYDWYLWTRSAFDFVDWLREQEEEPREQPAKRPLTSTAERITRALADGSADDPD